MPPEASRRIGHALAAIDAVQPYTADSLEALYGWPVDLLTEAMIKDPYFKQAVDECRTTLFVLA